MKAKSPLDELDMDAPPLSVEEANELVRQRKGRSLTDRDRVIALCKLSGRNLQPNLIQDVLAGDDKKRRAEVHRVIAKMVDDGTFGITIDWCLRLRVPAI